jgi:hypothetical protein
VAGHQATRQQIGLARCRPWRFWQGSVRDPVGLPARQHWSQASRQISGRMWCVLGAPSRGSCLATHGGSWQAARSAEATKPIGTRRGGAFTWRVGEETEGWLEAERMRQRRRLC